MIQYKTIPSEILFTQHSQEWACVHGKGGELLGEKGCLEIYGLFVGYVAC